VPGKHAILFLTSTITITKSTRNINLQGGPATVGYFNCHQHTPHQHTNTPTHQHTNTLSHQHTTPTHQQPTHQHSNTNTTHTNPFNQKSKKKSKQQKPKKLHKQFFQLTVGFLICHNSTNHTIQTTDK